MWTWAERSEALEYRQTLEREGSKPPRLKVEQVWSPKATMLQLANNRPLHSGEQFEHPLAVAYSNRAAATACAQFSCCPSSIVLCANASHAQPSLWTS